MTDTAPPRAPAPQSESSPPADSRPRPRAGIGTRLASAARALRLYAMEPFRYPRGFWPSPTVTSLLISAVLIVGAVELLPKTVSDVTLSVRARSEVIEIELDPARTYVWWLPAGRYSLIAAKTASAGCDERSRFDLACTYEAPTAITIKNGATVRFEVVPASSGGLPRFSAALTPRAADPKYPQTSNFVARSEADELLIETGDLMTFESAPVDVWRIPLILTRVQIGEFLSESISPGDTLGAVRQPIMTEGDVRIFARSFGARDRYQIQEERFDPADVVQIPAERGDDDGLLLGLLSLDQASERTFDVTLHTALAEVFVRRLGAEHRIGVSMWSIVSQLPTWAALWVVWVSLLVVANYHAARLQQLQGEPS